jgi:AGCS family alanine or glycine:cation symporter
VLFGIVLAAFVGVVIIGGIKRIAKVTDKLVPFMAIFYVSCCLIVLGANLGAIPEAFRLIFEGAFTGEGITAASSASSSSASSEPPSRTRRAWAPPPSRTPPSRPTDR